MGVTPNSDTQQIIAKPRSEHQTSRTNFAQISNKPIVVWVLLPAFLIGFGFDSHIDDGNTASIFKRLKSPVRFTGGQAVHRMSVTFTVTFARRAPFLLDRVPWYGIIIVSLQLNRSICINAVAWIRHQGATNLMYISLRLKTNLRLVTYFFGANWFMCRCTIKPNSLLFCRYNKPSASA